MRYAIDFLALPIRAAATINVPAPRGTSYRQPNKRNINMNRRKRLPFWGANEDDDRLPRNVINTKKTVTADTLDNYDQPDGEYGDGSDAVGDEIAVVGLRQRRRCIIRATNVDVIRFGNIADEVWRGEAFSSAQEFQDCHRRCLPLAHLHDDVEFVALRFELLEVVSGALGS